MPAFNQMTAEQLKAAIKGLKGAKTARAASHMARAQNALDKLESRPQAPAKERGIPVSPSIQHKARKMAEGVEVWELEGKKISIGDFIGFKQGIERSGKLVGRKGDMLVLSVWCSVEGAHYEEQVHVSRAWKE